VAGAWSEAATIEEAEKKRKVREGVREINRNEDDNV